MATSTAADKSGCASEKQKCEESGDDVSSATGDPNGQEKLDILLETFSRFEIYDFDGDEKFQSGLEKITTLPDWSKTNEHAKDMLKIKAFYYAKNVEPISLAAYVRWKERQALPHQDQNEAVSAPANSHVASSLQKMDTEANNNVKKELEVASSVSKPSAIASTSGPKTEEKTTEHSSITGKYMDKTVCDETVPHFSTDQSLQSKQGDLKNQGNLEQTDLAKQANVMVGDGENSSSSVVNNMWNSQSGELSFAEVAQLIQSGSPIPGLSQVDVTPTNEDPTPSQLARVKKPWEV